MTKIKPRACAACGNKSMSAARNSDNYREDCFMQAKQQNLFSLVTDLRESFALHQANCKQCAGNGSQVCEYGASLMTLREFGASRLHEALR